MVADAVHSVQRSLDSAAPIDLDLSRVFAIAWIRRWLVVSCVLLFLLPSLYLSFVTPTPYVARMVVATAGQTSASALGALGNLIGAQNAAEDREYSQFQALVKSVVLAERLQRKYGLLQEVFAGSWDPVHKRWVEPQGWRHEISKRLNQIRGRAAWTPPSIYDLADLLDTQLTIKKAQFSATIYELSYEDPDRDFAIKLLDLVHKEAEAALREERKRRTVEQVRYLRSRIETTNIVEYRLALVQLLADQEKTLMLLDSNLPVATTVVDPPNAPLRPRGPKLGIYLFVPVLFGLAVGVLAALIVNRRHARQRA